MPGLRVPFTVLCFLLLGSCSTDATNVTPAERAAAALPFKVQFVNDTNIKVRVVGCPGCGSGHDLSKGSSWLTALNGGSTEVTFDSGGRKAGCAHFVNGVLPEPGHASPPSVIRISQYSRCT